MGASRPAINPPLSIRTREPRLASWNTRRHSAPFLAALACAGRVVSQRDRREGGSLSEWNFILGETKGLTSGAHRNPMCHVESHVDVLRSLVY